MVAVVGRVATCMRPRVHVEPEGNGWVVILVIGVHELRSREYQHEFEARLVQRELEESADAVGGPIRAR